MAVDPREPITEDKAAPFTIGDTRPTFGTLNLGGLNFDSIIIPSAPTRIAEQRQEKEKQRQNDALITTVLDMINDPFFAEETNKFVETLWKNIRDNNKYTAFDIFGMNDEELYALIKEDKEAWNLYIDNLKKQYPHISREDIEKAALERIATKLREDAKLEIDNRISRSNEKVLKVTEQSIAMVLNLNEETSPKDIVDQLQASIEESQADFDRMVELAQDIDTFMAKHGTNAELAAQLKELEASMERQSALITFNVELKAFVDTYHEEFPNMTAQQIMVRGLMDDDLMAAYNDFAGELSPEQLQNITLQAAERLGLSPEDVQSYLSLMERTQAATDTIRDTIAKLMTGSKAVFDTKQIGTDGLEQNALIFRDYNGNFVTINYRTGAETQITESHIIAAIETAEAEQGDFLKVGHPDEMMALRKAFYDASVIELQKGIAQQEAIAKAKQAETEQTKVETPQMTPDQVQQFITDNKARVLAIFEANPNGVSADMLKYGLARLGIAAGGDLDKAYKIVSEMPEANILPPTPIAQNEPAAPAAGAPGPGGSSPF